MNRLELVFPPDAPAEIPEPTAFSIKPIAAAGVEVAGSADGDTALMTRTVRPGTSIRRLRNHRSAWHRRS